MRPQHLQRNREKVFNCHLSQTYSQSLSHCLMMEMKLILLVPLVSLALGVIPLPGQRSDEDPVEKRNNLVISSWCDYYDSYGEYHHDFDTGRGCVHLVSRPAHFLHALLDCRAQGGQLASVQSQKEQDILHHLAGATGAWIGLTDFLDVERWDKWVDGSAVNFTAWKKGQPNNKNNNQHCVWIRPGGLWDDIICKKKKPYVCQKPYLLYESN